MGWCWKYTSCPDPDIDRSCPDFSPKKPDIFTTLSTLQAENERLRAELENYRKGHREEAISALSPPNEPLTIEQLRAELEQVKRERDAAIEAANGLDKMIGRAWGED